MKKIERLTGIIYALKENRRLSAKEIADIFEVSERTIYRDIDALSQLNIPIIAYEGSSGGYEINKSYFIPSIALDEKEILSLLISLKIGELIKVPNMSKEIHTLKYKLLNTLEVSNKKKYMKLLDRICFKTTSMNPSNYRSDVMAKIIDSFLELKNLKITYYTPKKAEYVDRIITPYLLEFFHGGWYLNSYCHLRKDRRVFRLDRIMQIELTNEAYIESDVEKYMQNHFSESNSSLILLEIEQKLYETMKDDLIFKNSRIMSHGNSILIEVNTEQIYSIIQLALANPETVTILEPQSLINEIKSMSQKILDKY